MMRTILPDLPFTKFADAVPLASGAHSKIDPTTRAHPKTDLQHLTPWVSFSEEIHQAIESAMARVRLNPGHFDLIYEPAYPSPVGCEEEIRCHATFALHRPVERVLQALGVEGRFCSPHGVDYALIGEPDFLWISGKPQSADLCPKLVVEYKPWWEANLSDIPSTFADSSSDKLSEQSLEALHQVYGYMTLNNNRYGILTNWKEALFLRRTETSEKTLDYYHVKLDRPLAVDSPISMLKAWVGITLLAEVDWFCAPASIPEHGLGSPGIGKYQCLDLDYRLCLFDLSSVHRGKHGNVLETQILMPGRRQSEISVRCKVVDTSRYPFEAETLENEVDIYASLQNFQGLVTPKFRGYYCILGFLKILALQPVGVPIPRDASISEALRMKMKGSLRQIHEAGFIHGDIALCNFCLTTDEKVFLVNFQDSRRADAQTELDREMAEIDGL
ncbi:hypothetical protein CVT26_001292 [Gymnopilus dilepis]|uniref:Uncharacterized protein n=1 Tax=Gymnopilus dilepis TaxID=231916 RepID=A0A409Y1W1_9AGAR|nr:hypothetical protein CVT26_001292 [Gymnopilus dilepis]